MKTKEPFFKTTPNIFIAGYKHNNSHLRDLSVPIYTNFFVFFPRIKAAVTFKGFRAVSTAELQNSSVTNYKTNLMV